MSTLDDFESYADDESGRTWETWIDGYSDGSSGSTVGDRKNPQPGGTGRIHIDDIRLTKRMP